MSAPVLIETMRQETDGHYLRGSAHLARMQASATELGYAFDRDAALVTLEQTAPDVPQRARLTLTRAGEFALTRSPLGEVATNWRLALSDDRLDARDPWLRHKTSRRALYDRARAGLPEGIDEMVFLNEAGELCEGTITNLFLRRGERLLTPPLRCGLLPGILRAELLARGQAAEAVLTQKDLTLADQILVGNSLRGLIPAVLAG